VKQFFRCHKCGYEIESCPKCGQTTEHYPFTKQRIKTFLVGMGRSPELFDELWQTRQLFHGRVRLKDFQEIERIAQLVSELKAIVVEAIKANLGIQQTEVPFSPAPSSFIWSSMWLHGSIEET